MEISPIAGVRTVPAVKPSNNDPQLSAIFDINNAFGSQQDTFSQNGGKMTGGQDDEIPGEELPGEPLEDTPVNDSDAVNLFA